MTYSVSPWGKRPLRDCVYQRIVKILPRRLIYWCAFHVGLYANNASQFPPSPDPLNWAVVLERWYTKALPPARWWGA